MTDDEIFEMIKSPLFECVRKDETYYRIERPRANLTSTLMFLTHPVVKVAFPETRKKMVDAIKKKYKIGGLLKFKAYIDKIKIPLDGTPKTSDLIMKADYTLSKAQY